MARLETRLDCRKDGMVWIMVADRWWWFDEIVEMRPDIIEALNRQVRYFKSAQRAGEKNEDSPKLGFSASGECF